MFFFFSSRRRHTRLQGDWSSDVCSSDLCEDMMGEEGFYQSEEEQFFQRVHLLWRATRILLDVGLHTRGMTFEQAVEHMTTHLRVDRANAEAEVRRYCAQPAPPLCFPGGGGAIPQLG